jgi:hypothetical protein
MQVDDEIIFGRVLDETRQCGERIESSLAPADVAMSLAEFELHGATLRSLARWYPEEPRVRLSVLEWDLMALRLAAPSHGI